jgi:thymidylate synthase
MMPSAEHQYLLLLSNCLHTGELRTDRTGVGTKGVFGRQIRVDLAKEFPLLTTKWVHFRAVVVELLWMLAGRTNVRGLQEKNVHIWDEWAGPTGDLGPIYGKQWRSWERLDGGYIDQIDDVQHLLRRNPMSRRHIVSAWNAAEIEDMALPPCHCLFQFYVTADGRLSCQLYQRSADVFLGLPFNLASYSLLTLMMARAIGAQPGEFIHIIGDLHLYLNHQDQAREQLTRKPMAGPAIQLAHKRDILDFEEGDIQLLGYRSHPSIKAEVAV